MNHMRWLPSRAEVQGRTGKGPMARKGTGTKNSVVWGALVLCRWGSLQKEKSGLVNLLRQELWASPCKAVFSTACHDPG